MPCYWNGKKVQIDYIDNACCIYGHLGYRLLTDPWLSNGAFEGSWYHQTGRVDLSNRDIFSVDSLYISHIHPDHFDPETLKKFRKDIPIIVLDHGPNFLHRKLAELGFTNLVKVKDREQVQMGPFKVTVYAPFVKHPFDDSVLGNFLDSAIVIEDGEDRVLNANDNTPTLETAKELRVIHGSFTKAQLKYAAAGPYPACFTNLSHYEKLSEKYRLLARYEKSMNQVADALGAKPIPFAGSYCLAGSLAAKNEYLAVDGLDPTQVPEGKPYRYETKPEVSSTELYFLCEQAREHLIKFQQRFSFFPDYSVGIKLSEGFYYKFNFKRENVKIAECDLICEMDPRLLKQILTRESHWNNAEVGCHIDFTRRGAYNPDISTMMSFFHVDT
jgi:UDP-MurNAc hydroxylase